jgi:hypothetical protein
MSCELQKTGRKRKVKPEMDAKLKCFAFRGGKSCKRSAAIATGLCGCKPCIITSIQEEDFERFLSLSRSDGELAAAHWRVVTHARYRLHYELVNAELIAENLKIIEAKVTTPVTSAGASTSSTPSLHKVRMPKFGTDSSSSEDEVDEVSEIAKPSEILEMMAELKMMGI